MAVGGDDDTLAGSSPTISGASSDVPELVANRYRIVRWLGAGGMGRVYEAVDTELGEHVALKVLRAGLSEEAVERFRREVRLTRRVQHRNVARMFDIGEHPATHDKFLTMELIDGDSLVRTLGSPMPWNRLQSLALQICEGLAAAHEIGIVHRDLKPDNILVERTTERAVITDFGIARSADDAAVTTAGAVVGTPRYMAPEQLSGGVVDARSDVFSLGVMLYELANGTRPWDGENVIAIAVAQATQPAQPIRFTSLPTGFTALVARCIEIDPARRPQTAREMIATLLNAGAGPAGPVTVRARPTGAPTSTPATAPVVESTLAVLPVHCGAGDEYLADGLHEDLIDILSTTPGLRVRPAGGVRSPTDLDPRELGKQLGVDHVVVAALRRTPAAIRVSARMISVADGFQIWAHRAECAEAEVLATSERLAREIASALSTRATSTTRPTDPRSVDLYLRARAELRRYWGNHAQSAADLLDQALELSPSSGPIAGARAFATVNAWVLQSEPALYDRAKQALDDGLATGHPEAFLASASFKLNTGDPIGGAAALGTALVRAPMLAQSHEVTGKLLVELGAIAEARGHFETAIALDPSRSPVISMELARLDALEGWWERADARVETLRQDPDHSLGQLAAVFEARFAMWRNDRAAMLAAAGRFAPQVGVGASKLVDYIGRTGVAGVIDKASWEGFLATFSGPGRPQRGQLMGLQLICEIALVLDHIDSALETLAEADRKQLIDVVVLERCPLFDRVRQAPSFQRTRDSVAARAARVLAAFRSTAG